MKKVVFAAIAGLALAGQVQAESFISRGELAVNLAPASTAQVIEVVEVADQVKQGFNGRSPLFTEVFPAGSNKARDVVAFTGQVEQAFVQR